MHTGKPHTGKTIEQGIKINPIIQAQLFKTTLIHHQGVTCCVACGRSSLRSMTYTPALVAPWRLASDTLLAAGVWSTTLGISVKIKS